MEAIRIVENKLNFKAKTKKIKRNRIGDHKWYISDISKFKKHYPKWKQTYNVKKIIDEIINEEKQN